MKLYIIMLQMVDGARPQKVCFTSEEDGFSVQRETSNCWYLDDPPQGMPVRYRKADEYALIGNQYAVYIFGRERFRLIAEWNKATSAEL